MRSYMNTKLNDDLLRQESLLQKEIISIQEEIEILLIMLDRSKNELDQVQAHLSANVIKRHVAA